MRASFLPMKHPEWGETAPPKRSVVNYASRWIANNCVVAMEENKPTITVTRGAKRAVQGETPDDSSRSSTGIGLPGVGDVASGVTQGIRNAWLAGLGVLSVAGEASAQVFNALVEEGKSWEQAQRERTRSTARQVQSLREDGRRTVETVEEMARDEMDEVLKRMGVPRRSDLDELQSEVDELIRKVERLSRSIERAETPKEAS